MTRAYTISARCGAATKMRGVCQKAVAADGTRCDYHANAPVAVAHPDHYGGTGNPYEAIKVIEAWDLNFSLGNALKYICRAGKKAGNTDIEDLRKARQYLDFEIERLAREQDGR